MDRLYAPNELRDLFARVQSLCKEILISISSAGSYESACQKLSRLSSSQEIDMQKRYQVIKEIRDAINDEIKNIVFTYPPMVSCKQGFGFVGIGVDATNAAGNGHLYGVFEDFASLTPFEVFDVGDIVQLGIPRMEAMDKGKEVASIINGGTGITFTEDFEEDQDPSCNIHMRLKQR